MNNSADFRNRLEQLGKTEQWKQLSNFWKKLNYVENNSNQPLNWSAYIDNLRAELDNIKQILNELDEMGLLSGKEKTFLNNYMKDRFDITQYKTGFITCYMISPDAFEPVKSLKEMEKQYVLLEKQFEENKINEQTYTEARENLQKQIHKTQVYQDLKLTQEDTYSIIDILIYLNE